jgi:GNAT superfamily N-acetyltransferase
VNIEALERACLEAWPARTRETRFGWEFCATDGYSGRTNAIWPLAWTDKAPLGDAIESAANWCAEHGIMPTFKLSDGLIFPSHLPEALMSLGYMPQTETLVMTAPVALGPAPLSAISLLDFADVNVWSPLSQSAPDAKDYAERLDIVRRIRAPHVFALAYEEGAPACSGLAVLSANLVGIYLMRTAPWARRHGHGRRVLHRLLHWGATHDADLAYLQVEEANTAAVALYASEGFETAYRYRYWRR